MEPDKLTQKTQEALRDAQTKALRFGHTEIVPEHLLSRIVSLDYFGSFGLMPLGFLAAGALSGLASPQLLLALGGALSALVFAAALAHRGVRAVE